MTQMGFFVFLIVGLNLLQIWSNPSYDICFLKNLITNATILMLCLSFSFATILKYLVLAKRTVPEMNEGYVAKLSILLIILVSSGISSIKFFIGDTKPTFNQVRISVKSRNKLYNWYFYNFCKGNLYGLSRQKVG